MTTRHFLNLVNATASLDDRQLLNWACRVRCVGIIRASEANNSRDLSLGKIECSYFSVFYYHVHCNNIMKNRYQNIQEISKYIHTNSHEQYNRLAHTVSLAQEADPHMFDHLTPIKVLAHPDIWFVCWPVRFEYFELPHKFIKISDPVDFSTWCSFSYLIGGNSNFWKCMRFLVGLFAYFCYCLSRPRIAWGHLYCFLFLPVSSYLSVRNCSTYSGKLCVFYMSNLL